MRKLSFKIIAVVVLLSSFIARACPCGCGGARPISLHPGENTRAYFYLQEEQNKGYIAQNRKSGADFGPISNQRLGAAVAQRLSEHFNLFAEFGVSRNWHHTSGSDSSLADPTLGVQHIFHPIDLGEAALQFSLSGSYKFPVARGVSEVSHKDHNLDIHGNGSREILLTGDANLDFVTYGFSSALTLLQRKEVKSTLGDIKDPSLGYIAQIGVYYQIPAVGRTHLGISRDYLQADRVDGEKVDDSARLSHQIELGQQVRLADKRTLLISYASRGYATVDYNSPIYGAMRMGISQAF